MDGAAFTKAERFVEEVEIGSGTQSGRALEPIGGRFAGFGVDVAVVSLGEPGLEVGIELVEGRRLLEVLDLGFELFENRAIESFDESASLALIRLGMNELEAEGVAGGMETIGVERRSIVEVEANGKAPRHDESAEAEAESGEVLVEEVADLRDEPAEVIDEGAEERAPGGAVVQSDVRPVMEVPDDELERRGRFDFSERLLAEARERPARETDASKVPIESRAGELPARDDALADENVDDGFGGAVAVLTAEFFDLLDETGRELTSLAPILSPSGTERKETAATIGVNPSPERSNVESNRTTSWIGMGTLGHSRQRRTRAVRVVELDGLGDEAVTEGGDCERSFVLTPHEERIRRERGAAPWATAGTNGGSGMPRHRIVGIDG